MAENRTDSSYKRAIGSEAVQQWHILLVSSVTRESEPISRMAVHSWMSWMAIRLRWLPVSRICGDKVRSDMASDSDSDTQIVSALHAFHCLPFADIILRKRNSLFTYEWPTNKSNNREEVLVSSLANRVKRLSVKAGINGSQLLFK